VHELPSRRESVTQKLGIVHATGRASLYITSSLDPAGRIQEVFISVEKTGADERAYVDVASRYLSRELQSGVPLEDALAPYEVKTNPAGVITGYPKLGFCRGYLDAARKYLLAYQEELHAKQELHSRQGTGV